MTWSSARCVRCAKTAPASAAARCPCGGLFEIRHAFELGGAEEARARFDGRLALRRGSLSSGVWRFRELIAPDLAEESIVSLGEGNTRLYELPALASELGLARLAFKHEGENPTGSFKDRGMTVGVSQARHDGARALACASTGNTSASLAAFGAAAGLPVVVFVPRGKIARAKLAQALAYGARVLEIDGDFDDAMALVSRAASELDLALLNSVNPWRVEGQKSIVFEAIQELGWEPPDLWVFPAGNLGNASAFGKAFRELEALGLIRRRPRLIAVQAAGASPFARFFERRRADPKAAFEKQPGAETVASAIRIGDPQSWEKAIREVELSGGRVLAASDDEIMEAKARLDGAGVGCEPASAAALAGLQILARSGELDGGAAVGVLTGHFLKDADAVLSWRRGAAPGSLSVPARFEAIAEALTAILQGS